MASKSKKEIFTPFHSDVIGGAIAEVLEARKPGELSVMEFNNIPLLVGPNSTPENLKEAYHKGDRAPIRYSNDWDIKSDKIKTYTPPWPQRLEDAITTAIEGAKCFGEVVQIKGDVSVRVAPDSDPAEVLSRYEAELAITKSSSQGKGRGAWQANGKPIKEITYQSSSSTGEPIEEAAKIAIEGAKMHGLTSLERDGVSVLVNPDSPPEDVVSRFQKEHAAANSPTEPKGRFEAIEKGIIAYTPSTMGVIEGSFEEAIAGAKLLDQPVLMLSPLGNSNIAALVTPQSDAHGTFTQYKTEMGSLQRECAEHVKGLETKLLPAIHDRNEAEIVRLIGELASVHAGPSDFNNVDAVISGLTGIYGPPQEGMDIPKKRDSAEVQAKYIVHAVIQYLGMEASIPPRLAEQVEAYNNQPSGQGQGGTQGITSPRPPSREVGE